MFANSVDEEYDYIVVGSGAGGGPVAANLAKAGHRVLILEAGGAHEPYEYKVPAFHAMSTEHQDMAWKFYVRHYADNKRQLADERNYLNGDVVDGVPRYGVLYPRAGTLGGCTAHHAMIYVAPHDSDWKHIAKLTGDRSWLPHSMRKYFTRIERCSYVDRPWSEWWNRSRHGYDGWLPTSITDVTMLLRDLVLCRLAIAAVQVCFERRVFNSPGLAERFANWLVTFADPDDWRRKGLASRSRGWLVSLLDPNDRRWMKAGNEGPIFTPMTTHRGARFGTRDLIYDTLKTAPDRLTVKLNALVTRVILDDNRRATGVEFLDGAHLYRADPKASATDQTTLKPQTVRARREVILAGGTFNTPQLLMLSGIGPEYELRKHAVPVKVPLPGVGKNLQDRYEVGVVHKMKADFAILANAKLTQNDLDFSDWKSGYGLYATNGVILSMIKRSSHDRPEPDLFMFAIPGYFSGYRPKYSLRGHDKNYFTWVLLKGHTNNSAGEVKLTSADPCEPPSINFHYFDEGNDASGDDLDGVVSGIEFIRQVTRRTSSLFDEEIPGPSVKTREQLAEFVKNSAWGHHACGTCRIGDADDRNAVVDSNFKVRGTTGLRIVDASVFPKIPGFFILSAIYMIAEKASDAILADARRERTHSDRFEPDTASLSAPERASTVTPSL